MKYSLLLFLVSFSIYCFGQESEIDESDLIGCWSHSREENENKSEVMIYRSCDFKFPFSRYRHKFELKECGKCSWLPLAANDAHSMLEGSWIFEKEKQIIKIYNEKEKIVSKYYLIDIEDKVIKIRKL